MTLLAATLLNALWQDALLVLLVWLLLRAWPAVNAATRYVVWSAALIAGLAVPAITTYVTFVPARVVASAPSGNEHARASSTALRVAAAREEAHPASAYEERVPAKRRLEVPDRVRLTIPVNVARAVIAVWAVLAIYALLGLLAGLRRLARLKRDALPLPVEYRDAMPLWQRANKGRRAVRLCVSDDIDVPVAVGLFDAMILIPRDLLERLSPGEVEQISLHELAHLRRGDDWSNCLQRILIAALGWNPAAIFVAQQLELEREVACDDWVLSSVRSVRPYAMCLTKMAETAAWPHHPTPAPGVFTTRKQISLRIERLLAGGRDVATTLSPGPAAAAIAGVAAAAFAIAMVAPSIAAPDNVTAIAPMPSPSPRVRVRVKFVERVRIVRVAPVRVVAALATPARVASTAPSVAQAGARSAESSRTCSACDFHGVNWAGRDLHGANYAVVDFTRAILTGVNFSESRLSAVDFSGANLSAASFRQARLSGCDFSHASLVSADFTGAVLSACSLRGARLDGAHFAGAKLIECDLDGVDLRNVDLSQAKIVDMQPVKQPSPP